MERERSITVTDCLAANPIIKAATLALANRLTPKFQAVGKVNNAQDTPNTYIIV